MDEAAPREQPIPGPARPAFIRRTLKLALLAAVLVVHFLSRQYLVPTRPMREGWNYPYVYRTTLAILAGRGFGVFRFSDAPESKPVVEFLSGQRDGLSRQELRRFRDGPDGRPVAFPLPEAQTALPHYPPGGELATPLSPLHSSRVLDLYLTALLWKIFGVRWSVLLTACALVSTAVCLLVFFTARRLGGGFWPGLCAAVLYLASPLENDFAVRALRDISPLWFAALAFACLVCLVERFRSTAANAAALGLTGFACTLGCGWRPDAMLLVPFIAASAAVVVLRRRRGWRYLLAAAGAFLLGAVVPLAAIRVLAPASPQSPLVGFQMGYYGEYARCNLLGLENAFQVSRDDVDTAETAQQWHADHHPHAGPAPCYGPAYGAACLGMYGEEVLPNLFQWTWSFPRFYTRALDACRNRDLPINGSTYLPPLPRPRWLQPATVWLLEPLSAAGPWLFGLGAVVCLLRRGERGRLALPALLLRLLRGGAVLRAARAETRRAAGPAAVRVRRRRPGVLSWCATAVSAVFGLCDLSRCATAVSAVFGRCTFRTAETAVAHSPRCVAAGPVADRRRRRCDAGLGPGLRRRLRLQPPMPPRAAGRRDRARPNRPAGPGGAARPAAVLGNTAAGGAATGRPATCCASRPAPARVPLNAAGCAPSGRSPRPDSSSRDTACTPAASSASSSPATPERRLAKSTPSSAPPSWRARRGSSPARAWTWPTGAGCPSAPSSFPASANLATRSSAGPPA